MALAMQSSRCVAVTRKLAARAPARLLTTRVSASAGKASTSGGRREALLGASLAGVAIAAGLALPARADADLKTSKSGLQWKDVEEGTGPSPAKGSTINCHYTGRLTSGQVFDSSYPRGRPLSFSIGVGQVIKGWDMGILGTEDIPPMKAGGKRLLVIPPELGYGARGAGGVIPPNATLEFDVELVGKK